MSTATLSASSKTFIVIGALSLLAATQLSAIGFHALNEVLTPEKRASWQWATQMQFYHSMGLILVALLAPRLGSPRLLIGAGALMVLGLLLFSGSIYLGTLGVASVGQVAPLGGGSFMVAWLLVAIAAFRTRRG
ncbi:MAG: DUF423 domain-containing protein [Gammaproteobacteria bacterium]|nr:DUF423 domain-containing protein [Gammaproteobacteria bacterium]